MRTQVIVTAASAILLTLSSGSAAHAEESKNSAIVTHRQYLRGIRHTSQEVDDWFAGKAFPFSKHHPKLGWLLPNRTSDVNNPYFFTGRRYDGETDLYYYRARYYDYYIGRFLQPDPIGYRVGLNLYSYCSNNPTSFADPTGLVPKGDHPFAVLKLRPNAVLRVTTSDNRIKGYRISTATDIVKVMIKSKVTNNPIVAFEYIGHGDVAGNGLGVAVKEGQLTGIYYVSDDKPYKWLREMAQSEPDVYSMESLGGLIAASFSPKAKVLLHGCYTAGSIGKEFKRVLPEAEVWGYTGIAKIDSLWGMAYPGENSELIKIGSPNPKECSK